MNTLLDLWTQAEKVIPANFLGITTIPTGDAWKAIVVPVAIFIWFLTFWFCVLSTISILSSLRQMHFSLN